MKEARQIEEKDSFKDSGGKVARRKHQSGSKKKTKKSEAILRVLAQFQQTAYTVYQGTSEQVSEVDICQDCQQPYDDSDKDAKKYWIGCDSCVRW